MRGCGCGGEDNGSGQFAYKVLNELLGTPFSEEKRQAMSSAEPFLGLDYDVEAALRKEPSSSS